MSVLFVDLSDFTDSDNKNLPDPSDFLTLFSIFANGIVLSDLRECSDSTASL